MALRKRVAAPPGHLQGECRAADRGSLWHRPSGHRRALTPPGPGAATRESPAPTPWGSRGHPRGCPGPLATGIPPPFPRGRSGGDSLGSTGAQPVAPERRRVPGRGVRGARGSLPEPRAGRSGGAGARAGGAARGGGAGALTGDKGSAGRRRRRRAPGAHRAPSPAALWSRRPPPEPRAPPPPGPHPGGPPPAMGSGTPAAPSPRRPPRRPPAPPPARRTQA
ncbi:proline-rich protein 7 isoform X4 [Molothrus ater]|uniref:proline-rich protein 7 isoform X4 n=1 Tax=Molothrus ater TaxID=84834 RepID=UPI0023E778FD|nr:proline-rich protein 7 isoform X4 [Molothrus ater]